MIVGVRKPRIWFVGHLKQWACIGCGVRPSLREPGRLANAIGFGQSPTAAFNEWAAVAGCHLVDCAFV